MSRATRRGILALALVLGAAAAASRADENTRRFMWDEANARLAAAQRPADYLVAARVYNALVRDGVRNGPLFFNLGTALLLAGDGENAAAALQRAERYSGSTPGIRANLRLALAARSGQPDAELPWNRVAFFWHYDLPVRTRVLVALAAWALVWLAILARPLAAAPATGGAWARLRAVAGAGLVLAAVLGGVYAASAGVSLLQERADDRAWPERVFVAAVEHHR